MKPPERFQTQRLILRKPVPTDANSIFHAYAQDAEVTRYLIWTPHTRIEETQVFVNFCMRAWQEGKRFPYVITEAGRSEAIGMIELRLDRYKADVGYVLSREYWSKGYVTESLRAIVDWWREQPELYRLWAVCDVDNIASARVMEKAGMQREGRLRREIQHPNIDAEPRDCYIYSMVK
jgi:[ribosomal protein S5]-alanine N-acetyltransferase